VRKRVATVCDCDDDGGIPEKRQHCNADNGDKNGEDVHDSIDEDINSFSDSNLEHF